MNPLEHDDEVMCRPTFLVLILPKIEIVLKSSLGVKGSAYHGGARPEHKSAGWGIELEGESAGVPFDTKPAKPGLYTVNTKARRISPDGRLEFLNVMWFMAGPEEVRYFGIDMCGAGSGEEDAPFGETINLITNTHVHWVHYTID